MEGQGANPSTGYGVHTHEASGPRRPESRTAETVQRRCGGSRDRLSSGRRMRRCGRTGAFRALHPARLTSVGSFQDGFRVGGT